MHNTSTVLFVEDHQMVRESIKFMLKSNGFQTLSIFDAENGFIAREKAAKNHYDLILLDINLPDTDGLTLLQTLLNEKREQKILILTSHNEPNIIRKALGLGAMGYLLKICGTDELSRAIQTVLKGEKYYCNEAAMAILEPTVKESTYRPLLSRRELEVLLYVGNELSNIQIAEITNLSVRTIEGHRRKIRSKLNIKSTTGLIKYAIENNLMNSK